jgi:hypothetical protein
MSASSTVIQGGREEAAAAVLRVDLVVHLDLDYAVVDGCNVLDL